MIQTIADVHCSCHLIIVIRGESTRSCTYSRWRYPADVVAPHLLANRCSYNLVMSRKLWHGVQLHLKNLLGLSSNTHYDPIPHYLCRIVEVHLTSWTLPRWEISIKWVAKNWNQWTRLIEIKRCNGGRKVNVANIGDEGINHSGKLIGNILRSQQGFLSSCIVYTWQYII